MTSPNAERDALAARLFSANIAAYEVATVYLGDRLGFYRALVDLEGADAPTLAKAAGTDARYTREWLEQQAAAGILAVEDPAATPETRRFLVPAGHATVLLDRDHLAYLAPLARFTVGVFSGLPKLIEAFRSGAGVPYRDYGADAREGQADVNRTMFVNLLGESWLPSIEDVHARLARPGARVADLGCGTGWSSIAIAKAYPEARVDGFDLDAPSIDLARANARATGVEDRTRFEVRDAAEAPGGGYDLVTIFEALHDMARPVAALETARRLLAPGGSVLVADERTLDAFTPGAGEGERLFYAWSVLFCLPTSREETSSAATGAVMRVETLRRYAREAGFAKAEIAPIEHDLWRFYRLTP